MEIRRLGPADVPLLLTASHLFDRPPDPVAAAAFLADPHSHLLLSTVDGVPAGFIRAHTLLQVDSVRPQFFLYEISVDPPYQRQGIARTLITALHDDAHQAAAEEDFVLTDRGNLPAMALYQATGGVEEGEDTVMFVYPFPHPEDPKTSNRVTDSPPTVG